MRIRTFTQNWLVLTLAVAFGLPMLTFAQKPDRAPEPKPQNVSPVTTTPAVGAEKALWDLQFAYDVSTDHGEASMSNGFFVNNEFWIAEWNSDFIARYAADGTYIDNFSIAGLSGARSFTSNGTSVFITNNSNSIFEVNPVTQELIGTINSPIPDLIRWVTYDANADGGNGGFRAGNFSTAIYELAMDGSQVGQIAAATHTLGGMYGAAVDNSSPGGPYLWVFSQAGEPIDAVIYQLQLPAGTPTGVGRNVELDLGTSGALAGGLFITDEWDTTNGTMTIAGVTQGEPDIVFGYELTFEPGPNFNPGVAAITGPVTACGLTNAETVTIDVVNNGTEVLTDIPVTLFVNGEEIVTETVPGPLAAGATTSFSFAQTIDMSTPGLFFLDVLATSDTDVSNINDLASGFAASKAFDTTVELIAVFEDYMPADFVFDGLYNEGDITFFAWDQETGSAGTGPSTDASGSGNFIYMEASGFAAGDQSRLGTDCLDLTDAESVTMSFFYHMFGLAIGSLSVDAVNESGATVNIWQQAGQVQSATTDPWEAELLFIEDPNIIGQTVEIFFTGTIGNLGDAFTCDIGLDDISISKVVTGIDEISTLNSMKVMPNPVEGLFAVQFDLSEMGGQIRIQLFDNVGRQLDIIEAQNLQDGQFDLDASGYAPGVYHLQLTVDGQVATKKIVVQ